MGIFAVRVSGADWGPLDAVASVGTRPTFAGTKPLLEVHIFDFDQGYLRRVHIHVDFVRPTYAARRSSMMSPELIEQMDLDSARAREILAA